MHSASLMGVNLNEDKIDEIKQGKYSKVFLSLDADATDVAVRTSIKFRRVLPQLQIVGLSKDVKDMTEDEFKIFLEKLQ
jgi:hypothetical protein